MRPVMQPPSMGWRPEFRVAGLGLRFQGLGFRVLRFRAKFEGLRLRAYKLRVGL